MRETKTMSIDEIITLSFRKYRTKGRSQMDTFVFTNTKKLSDEEYDKIYEVLNEKIKEYEEMKKQKAEEEMLEEISKIKILGVS